MSGGMVWFVYFAGLLTGLVSGVFVTGKVGVIFIIVLAVVLAASVGLMFLAYGWHITKMVRRYDGEPGRRL